MAPPVPRKTYDLSGSEFSLELSARAYFIYHQWYNHLPGDSKNQCPVRFAARLSY